MLHSSKMEKCDVKIAWLDVEHGIVRNERLERKKEKIIENKQLLLKEANRVGGSITKRGGGARDIDAQGEGSRRGKMITDVKLKAVEFVSLE